MAALAYNSIYGSADPNDMTGGYSTGVQQAAVAGVTAGRTTPTGISASTATGATVPGSPATVAPGDAPAGGGMFAGSKFFGEGGVAATALGAIQTLGNLWSSFQQNKLAKETFEFNKEAYYTNLENQEKSYNTALEDRISTRYQGSGGSAANRDAEIARKSL